MSLEVFRKALAMCEDYGQAPFLGGGEPTLHKHFEQMLLEAIAVDSDGQVGIVTNGSITRRALVIAKLAQAGVIYAQVSLDKHHDPIHHDVMFAFENIEQSGHGQGVRNTTRGHEPMPHGRAIELLGYEDDESPERGEDDCPCPNWLVKPNGDIHQCGCDDSPIVGHVNEYYPDTPNGCHTSQEYTNYIVDNE